MSLQTPWRGSKEGIKNTLGVLNRSLEEEVQLSVECDSGFRADLSGRKDDLLQIWWTLEDQYGRFNINFLALSIGNQRQRKYARTAHEVFVEGCSR